MNFPTWGELIDYHCTAKEVYTETSRSKNPFYEPFGLKRFNYASTLDKDSCRLVFSKSVLSNPDHKTLCRKGRFLWCKNLKYEGKSSNGLRSISFTVDKGNKRFCVEENNILCIPSKIYVSNNKYFRTKDKVFFPFSTVFSYANTTKMMAAETGISQSDMQNRFLSDSPYKPGTLVAPRLGYFYPDSGTEPIPRHTEHPCGIILGPALIDNGYIGRELYRVRFGETTYEKVHPIQMEVIHEV